MSKVINVQTVNNVPAITTNARVCIVINRPGLSDIPAWFAALPEYDSNESAIADGLSVGDWYVTALNHLSGMPGALIKVT